MAAHLKRYITKMIILLFNCLPIQENKIFLFSYYGSQYGDSPKYITEYILRNEPKGKYDVVWAFNDIRKKQHLTGFRKVKTMSLRYFYELCTSKVIITNFRTTDLFVKRKRQYYVQTWHSSLRLKQIEKDAESTLPSHYVEMAKKDSKKCDLLLSGCEYSTRIFKKTFWYDGEIFEHGTPANDILINRTQASEDRIYERLGVKKGSKIALYAPTFRKNSDISIYNVDYAAIMKALSDKFGGEWVFLIRLHPHLSNISDQINGAENVINATRYDDVQELILVSDVLITDYSSIMFSFFLTQKPCFLYVPDLEDYISQDRKLYFDLKDLPFVSVQSNQQLLHEITNFDRQQYSKNLSGFSERIGSFEKGEACENLLNKIERVCFI